MLQVGIKYSMHDLICDVINYSTFSCNIGEICVHDKIVLEN